MSEIPQIQRIIRLLELFSMGRRITCSELHEYFDNRVSLRTIQRDINTILDAGIPLVCEQKFQKENIWSFPRDYRHMLLPAIQENELLSIYMLKSYLKEFRDTTIASSLESVIDKLEDMAPGDVYLDADSGTDILWDQDYGGYDYRADKMLIENMIETIRSGSWLEVMYKARGQSRSKTYTIFPYKLFSYHGSLYTAVYDLKYGKVLSLVLQRIQSTKVLGESPEQAPEFDLETFRKKRFGVFGGKIEIVQLKIDREYKPYFKNRSWHPSQKMIEEEDGSLLLSMEVPLSPELLTWILGWHEAITVLTPQSLISEIKEKLNKTMQLY